MGKKIITYVILYGLFVTVLYLAARHWLGSESKYVPEGAVTGDGTGTLEIIGEVRPYTTLSPITDPLDEIIHEQTIKAIYHAEMQLKYIDSDYPLSKKHLDSLLMANYAVQVVDAKMNSDK